MSDFYEDSARRRLEVIDAERQAALADLSAHKMNQDHDSAAQTIQTIADLDFGKAALCRSLPALRRPEHAPGPRAPHSRRVAEPALVQAHRRASASGRHRRIKIRKKPDLCRPKRASRLA